MENAALRMQQAIWQNDYRQQMGAAATSRAGTYQQIAGSRQESADAMMLRAQTGAATAQERLALAQANAAERAGKGTWQATEGPDPDNPGQKIPGMAFLPTGGGQPTFFPTVVQSRAQVAQQNADTAAGRLPIAQQNADANTTRAATGQENTGLRRQALANAADINERRLIETSTDAQLREANSYISAHTQKDVNGNITKQPKMGEALAAIQGARGAAQPPAVAAPTAPRTVAPPTVQAPIPPGLPPNAKQAPNGEWYVPNPSGSGWLHATPNVGAGGT